MQTFFGSLVTMCLLFGAADADRGREAQHDWPQWRGPLGTGVAPDAQPPVEWSETKNIRWKSALPGKGHSTPDRLGRADLPDHGDSVRRASEAALPFAPALTTTWP